MLESENGCWFLPHLTHKGHYVQVDSKSYKDHRGSTTKSPSIHELRTEALSIISSLALFFFEHMLSRSLRGQYSKGNEGHQNQESMKNLSNHIW